MKKLFLTSALVAVCAGAFAQGKVNVINDSSSLVTLTTDTSRILPADRGLAGQPVGDAVPLPSGITLVAGLYAGTSSSQLFLYGYSPLNSAAIPAGNIPAYHVVLNAIAATGAPAIPGIASGTAIGPGTPWFQVNVWDSAYATYAAAVAAGSAYVGQGALFQLNPGPSLAYTFTSPPGANTTWSETPIITTAPEPSVFALAGLGAAALMIFRRRK